MINERACRSSSPLKIRAHRCARYAMYRPPSAEACKPCKLHTSTSHVAHIHIASTSHVARMYIASTSHVENIYIASYISTAPDNAMCHAHKHTNITISPHNCAQVCVRVRGCGRSACTVVNAGRGAAVEACHHAMPSPACALVAGASLHLTGSERSAVTTWIHTQQGARHASMELSGKRQPQSEIHRDDSRCKSTAVQNPQ